MLGVGGIAVYGLFCLFGRSNADDASQQFGLISDAKLSDDDTDKAMWEAGKHDIAKTVDVQIIPKLTVREVRTPEQIQVEDQVDEKTALAMSSEEFDDFAKPIDHGFDDGFVYINPATGLLILDGPGGIDVGGNPDGIDLHDMLHDDSMSHLNDHDDWHRSSFDD